MSGRTPEREWGGTAISQEEITRIRLVALPGKNRTPSAHGRVMAASGAVGAGGSSLVRCHRGTRYPPEGGLTAERQQFPEGIYGLKEAERFARGEASSVIAKALRARVHSVQLWRRSR